MNTYLDVKATVRSIIGDDDPNGWLKESYLGPKVNFMYRRQTLYIKRATGSNLERMVEIPNALDANSNPTNQGLTSLAVYQQPENLLDGLYEPLYLWYKPAGSPDGAYREMVEKKTILPGRSTTNDVSTYTTWGNRPSFTWRGNQIFLTPTIFPIDILVDGRFNPPALVKDEDYLVVDADMEVCVSSGTIPIIGIESGNAGYLDAVALGEACADDIVAKIIRGKQGQTARAGSNSRRAQGCGWFWR